MSYRSVNVISRPFGDGAGRRLASVALCAAISVVLLLFVVLVPSARAVEEKQTYLFNANLSLTGDCSTSEADPVADPGLCPMPPGVPGVDHPTVRFHEPEGAAIDAYGDRYVSNLDPNTESGHHRKGPIDVFDPSGRFLTELSDPNNPGAMAVDGEGNLLVVDSAEPYRLDLYVPVVYRPLAGEVQYSNEPTLVYEESSSPEKDPLDGVSQPAIDNANGHVFIADEHAILELGSAAENYRVLSTTVGKEHLFENFRIALDAAHKRIYATAFDQSLRRPVVRVFELEPPYTLLETIDGSSTPDGRFLSTTTFSFSIAVDETTGHLFVADFEAAKKRILELTENGEYVSSIAHSFQALPVPQLAVDNGPHSPRRGDVFMPSGQASLAHSYAFEPTPPVKAPVVESFAATGVTEDEARLMGAVNPQAQATTYRLEYTTQQSFEEEGFTHGVVVGEGMLEASNEASPVSAKLAGLALGTAYRARVVAHNEAGDSEAQAVFVTYRRLDQSLGCENESLRTSFSAALPDCRAYELVTPSNTDGHAPFGLDHIGIYFATRETSPTGDKVSFEIEGGGIPGVGGTGSFTGDSYLSTRGADGWTTASAGPNGIEAPEELPGSVSPDQGYSFWYAEGEGTASVNGENADYVRYPDGHSELVGRGSLTSQSVVEPKLISENGSHIIFVSDPQPMRLEPNAPPDGTAAIYDRTADEVTHVVSLLPGEVTPQAGEAAGYRGASLNGKGVAFEIGSTLYLRYNDEETFRIGDKLEFAGIAEGGARLFYVEGGDLFAFDAHSNERIRFTSSGDATVVNVSSDGSVAYFVSPSVEVSGRNPNGALPQVGSENLYVSREGAISFVGTITERDVQAEGVVGRGLGAWTSVAGSGSFGDDPSRSTTDGAVLLFESRAALTGYDSQGHVEIYRYDAGAGTLTCLSCNPTMVPATGDASLQSVSRSKFGESVPLDAYDLPGNLRDDGKRAFFQSTEGLVEADTDGLQDVYEWEQDGVGSCRTAGGCVYLVTSGKSPRDNYLYATSDSGNDVFFETSDLLVPSRDFDETSSIYDARVGGGFPEPPVPSKECLGEACQPAVMALSDPTPSSFSARGRGNPITAHISKKTRCAKGRHVVRRARLKLCVVSHKKRHPRHRKHRVRPHRTAGRGQR